jgi:ABC-type sugar transport system permease subunit
MSYQYIGTVKQRLPFGTGALRDNWFAYLLLAPTLIALVGILWVPFLRGVWMSLHSWTLGEEPTFIGLENYAYLLGWEPFWTSLEVTLIFSSTTFMQLGIALAAALLVNSINKHKALLSGLFLLPYTMPPVITGSVWFYLLDPSSGPIFQGLIDLGVLSQPIYWTTQGGTATAVITLVTTWTFWPFMFLVILASLENIPQDHYESAKVYGASKFQQFRHVTLPQLKTAILLAFSIRMIWNLAKVSQPLQLTGGGPGYESSLLAMLLYEFTEQRGELGLSFAMGVILLLISLVFIVLFIREYQKASAEQRGA